MTCAEHVPLDLREREADVLVGQQRVLAAARFLEGAVDDPFGRLSHLVLRDVEIVHGRLQRRPHPVQPASRYRGNSKSRASDAEAVETAC